MVTHGLFENGSVRLTVNIILAGYAGELVTTGLTAVAAQRRPIVATTAGQKCLSYVGELVRVVHRRRVGVAIPRMDG